MIMLILGSHYTAAVEIVEMAAEDIQDMAAGDILAAEDIQEKVAGETQAAGKVVGETQAAGKVVVDKKEPDLPLGGFLPTKHQPYVYSNLYNSFMQAQQADFI